MRALLYADWCAIHTPRSLVCLLFSLVLPALFVGRPAESSPSGLLGVSAACLFVMSTYFLLFMLFGTDERNGWEAGRLRTLDVTARQVVRARYTLVALVSGALLVLAVPLEMACFGLMSALHGGVPNVPVPSMETFLVLMLAAGANLVLIGAQMAAVFALGTQLGRIALILPYLLAFGAFPWLRDTLSDLGARMPSTETALGIVVCLVVGILVYLLCLRAAQAIYARREL